MCHSSLTAKREPDTRESSTLQLGGKRGGGVRRNVNFREKKQMHPINLLT